MPVYMKFGSVRGDVQETGHTDWIELSSARWNVERPLSNPAGSAAGRVLAAPRISEVTVGKDEDVATIPLIQESLVGTPRDAQIDFVRTGQDPLEIYFTITMKEVLITAIAQSSAGDRPIESLTLNFTQISFKGTQMDSDGSGTSPSSYGWDLKNNTPA